MRFKKGKERLDGELILFGLTLAKARMITKGGKSDPMFESLPVSSKLARHLQNYSPEVLDTSQFDYFLERRRTDDR